MRFDDYLILDPSSGRGAEGWWLSTNAGLSAPLGVILFHALVFSSPDHSHSSFYPIWQDKPCPLEDKRKNWRI